MRIQFSRIEARMHVSTISTWLGHRFPDLFAHVADEHRAQFAQGRLQVAEQVGFRDVAHVRHLLEYELEYGILDVVEGSYVPLHEVAIVLTAAHVSPGDRIQQIEKALFFRDIPYERSE